MEISLSVFFRGCNAPKCVMYLSVASFVTLLSMRLDGREEISYALVFSPLVVLHALALLGALVGVASLICRPLSEAEQSLRTDLVAMLMSAAQHILLACFSALAFLKLEFYQHRPYDLPWVLAFSPLYAEALIACIFSVWAIRHDKSFEFEFFFAVNVIQFVFVAFKLDNQVDWSWAVVFVPLWVVLSLSVVAALYALVLSVLLTRAHHLLPQHRRHTVYAALVHTLLVVPALLSLVLLTGKLDSVDWTSRRPASDLPFTLAALPLVVSLLCLLLLGCGRGGGNVWWFGLRKPFCHWLLDTFPMLRQYANVSYKVGARRASEEAEAAVAPPPIDDARQPLKPLVPFSSIECPD